MRKPDTLDGIVKRPSGDPRTATTLRYKRFSKELPALHRVNPHNAGYDLFARIDASISVTPGDVVRIPLNVATAIPPHGVGLLFQRSSTFQKWGLRLTNGVGVIDSCFSGEGDEWIAEFQNMTPVTQVVRHGDKLCQAVFVPLLNLRLEECESLSNPNRGGFGTSFNNISECEAGQ